MPQPPLSPSSSTGVAVIGGGPAGLMAAEMLADAGHAVTVFEAMSTVGRKFLLAGRGGLNLTHAEDLDVFLDRYGERRDRLEPLIRAFPPQALRDWAAGLGIPTFVGSSGKVFPQGMKAAPLLRAWVARLRAAGVRFAVRHRWLGWSKPESDANRSDHQLRFATPDGGIEVKAAAVVLALGGGSWPKFGADGAWVALLRAAGTEVAELQPANCGFDVGKDEQTGWSTHFAERFRGQPLKSLRAGHVDASGQRHERRGECLISATGLEGSLIYALSAMLRERIAAQGEAILELDLAPERSVERLAAELARPRGRRSMANHLHSQAGIHGAKAGLLRECADPTVFADPLRLAAAIKALPVRLIAARPLAEAISSAGGVCFGEVDASLMLRAMPGVFLAGEMLDWEAPTGGYLLSACFASGRHAGLEAAGWLRANG